MRVKLVSVDIALANYSTFFNQPQQSLSTIAKNKYTYIDMYYADTEYVNKNQMNNKTMVTRYIQA